jgi:hypothetical protein
VSIGGRFGEVVKQVRCGFVESGGKCGVEAVTVSSKYRVVLLSSLEYIYFFNPELPIDDELDSVSQPRRSLTAWTQRVRTCKIVISFASIL